MSIKSQEGHMRQLALLLTTDLGCIFGERESGPNGSKKAFLNVGKVFLRALAKDLGLHEVTVSANSGRHRGVGNMLPLWNVGGQRHCGVDRAALMRGWEGALLSDDPKQQGLQRRIQSFSHQQRPENLVISAAFGDAECFAEGWVSL